MNIDNFISRLGKRFCFYGGGGGGSGANAFKGAVVMGGSGGDNSGAVRGVRVGAILATIPIPVPLAGAPVNGPTFNIPDGYYLEVGPIPLQTQSTFFSTVSRQAAITGPREIIIATQQIPRQIDVRNLSDLWVNSSVNGEGIQVTVRKLV